MITKLLVPALAATLLSGPLAAHAKRGPANDERATAARPADPNVTTATNPERGDEPRDPPPRTPEDEPVPQARNVLIATYNIQQLVFPESNNKNYFDENGDPIDDTDRAGLIAKKVHASDLEIVAFQEVFASDSRARIIDILDDKFPYHVDYIGNDTDSQDSGLMLFSRYPFEKMTLEDENMPDSGDVDWVNDGAEHGESHGYVGFIPFTCDSEYAHEGIKDQSDCYATKGVGLVRIELPMGESLFVAFSHFVAHYKHDGEDNLCAKRDDRARAFGHTETLLKDAAEELDGGNYDPLQHHFVMLGDLNINGNPAYTTASEDHSPCRETQWSFFFDPFTAGHAFTSCGPLDDQDCANEGRTLVDAWGYDTSPEDLGKTSSQSFLTDLNDSNHFHNGKRLDYVLYRGTSVSSNQSLVQKQMTPQHLTIPRYISGTSGELSDHLPVAVDLLLPPDDIFLEHETPRKALPLQVTTNVAIGQLEIDVPGQVQWTLMSGEPGTYRVWTGGAQSAGFDVYTPNDLSRPIRPRRIEEDRGSVYLLNNPPYYIKTYAGVPNDPTHDRQTTGSYDIRAERFDCQSVNEACYLDAGTEGESVTWPAQMVNAIDSLFFVFLADVADEPVLPTHFFAVTAEAPLYVPEFEFEVLTFPSAQPIPDLDWLDTEDGPRRQAMSMQGVQGSGVEPTHKEHLLRVGRTDSFFVGTTHVSHASNLTYFVPMSVTVSQENDDSAHDELWVGVEASADLGDLITGANVHNHMGRFTELPLIDESEDGGREWPASAELGIRRYVTQMSVVMVEDDDEDDIFEPGDLLLATAYDNNALRAANGQSLLSLPQNVTSMQFSWHWSDLHTVPLPSDSNDTDYWYQMNMRLSQVPPCVLWNDIKACN